MEERELIEQARSGDARAFRALVEQHQRRAYGLALGILHDQDEARDVCQEAFLRVHRSLGTFNGEAQFSTWLYRIVSNLCIDHLRRRRGDKLEFDEASAHDDAADDSGIAPRRLGFDPARALQDKELRGRIGAALAQLSAAHRTVLVLREVEGLSYQEMADEVGCSIGTIMSRLFHARKRMQALLADMREQGAEAPREDRRPQDLEGSR